MNGWITMVESFINFFIKGINVLVRGINKLSFNVPDWVPGIGGNKLGLISRRYRKCKFPASPKAR